MAWHEYCGKLTTRRFFFLGVIIVGYYEEGLSGRHGVADTPLDWGGPCCLRFLGFRKLASALHLLYIGTA